MDHVRVFSVRLFWVWFGVIIAADQLSKIIAQYYSMVLINKYISFSLFAEFPPVLITLGTVLTALLVAGWGRDWWSRFPTVSGWWWGGVSSNLIDRLVFGGVRDWLPIPFTQLNNNLADYAISIGLVGLVWQGWRASQVRSRVEEDDVDAHNADSI